MERASRGVVMSDLKVRPPKETARTEALRFHRLRFALSTVFFMSDLPFD
jgi:hypothetical protein